ncbi:hypothetical protein HanXRQr2_Chr04g0191331 [Helianthus annuus]|uniref:Uncharacterized protein n=1 Tax=Helianthus annuus TaxID=4232 RepID=A0A9K3JC66_HELAN|nr:hypothetical protein HanXRQr2_Chr04g0191331 [Helianthus annuus]KAJ0933446.1 hypothetical protein HanPSC8_Chr04g0184891 [Helianthus annuus]
MAKLEAVADAPMGRRRRRLVHFQFSPTPNFPVFEGFWLREKLIAVADAL